MYLSLILALAFLFQGTPNNFSDGLKLLNKVAQRYATATSYHIEAVKEESFAAVNGLQRTWQKRLLSARAMPGGRYRYEGHTGDGWAIVASDGTTKWKYLPNAHLYTRKPASPNEPRNRGFFSDDDIPLEDAKLLVKQFEMLTSRLNSATLARDEEVVLDGHTYDCYVVRYTSDDLKAKTPEGVKLEGKIWIDKARNVVVKALERGQTLVSGGFVATPEYMERTTVFPVVDFGQQAAVDFVFIPPTDTRLVDAFPTRVHSPGTADPEAAEFVGKPAPEMQLTRSDGKVTRLSSLRGKPVLLEFWATWCAPCLERMPDLKKLYAETADTGLQWISIDSDTDASTAAAYLANEHIPWRNYHDEDGSLGKAFRREGIPLTVLIDADGKVAYYATDSEAPELRMAIAKLGPQFSSVIAAVPSAKR